jgi:hypothetical protein
MFGRAASPGGDSPDFTTKLEHTQMSKENAFPSHPGDTFKKFIPRSEKKKQKANMNNEL